MPGRIPRHYSERAIRLGQADARVGHREMLREVLPVGGHQPADVLAPGLEPLQQRHRDRVEVPQVDQRLRNPGRVRSAGRKYQP